jgi:hypothetical protein
MNLQFLSEDPILRQFLVWAVIGGGMGILVQKTLEWLIRFVTEETTPPTPPSPRTKRWLAYGISVLEPTLIYALYVLIGVGPYVLSEHIGAILAAFAGSQAFHAVSRLPTGKDLEVQALEVAAIEAGTPLPPKPVVHNAAVGTYVVAGVAVLGTLALLLWAIASSPPGVCANCRATPTPIVPVATATATLQATQTPTRPTPVVTIAPVSTVVPIPTVPAPFPSAVSTP